MWQKPLENTDNAEKMIDFEEKIMELYSAVKTDTKQLIPKPDDGPELLENVELEESSKSSVETVVETTEVSPDL